MENLSNEQSEIINNDNNKDVNKKTVHKYSTNHWEELLPSSSNWYCTSVADCNEQYYIYACKSNVLIFDIYSKKFIGELNGHTDRVTSVSFFKKFDDENNNDNQRRKWCITGSDDKTIRIWKCNFDGDNNNNNSQPNDDSQDSISDSNDNDNDSDNVNQCIYYHQEHKSNITCLVASPLVSDLVISGDKEGSLVLFRTLTNHVFPISPLIGNNISIISLSFSPNQSDLIAIGYINGIVLIYNFVIRSILCKISAHSSDVLSIIWFDSILIQKNKLFNSSGGENNDGIYLATCSKDKSIKLWKKVGDKIESGFTNIYQLNPSKYSVQHTSGGGSGNDKQRVWLNLSWSPDTPQYLLSNSLTADILLWDLNNFKAPPEKFQSGHQRLIFNITQIPKKLTSNSITNSSSSTTKYINKAISVSLDRQIIIWENLKVKTKIQAMGGFIYSIDTCTFTPNTFVIGCGDNTIRLWSPTENLKDAYESKTLWKGIQSKVTSLSICKDFGFNNSNLIAFGMDDGRVGIYNVNSNQSKIFPGGHKNEIYEIIWRPPNNNLSSTEQQPIEQKPNKLYSIGNNEIYEWDYNDFDKGFKNITPIIQSLNPLETFSKHKTDINFNLDGDLISIGYSDGTIDIFDSEFHFLTRIREHKKLINRVKWNHFQENKMILASASTDKKVLIYKLSIIEGDNEIINNQENIINTTKNNEENNIDEKEICKDDLESKIENENDDNSNNNKVIIELNNRKKKIYKIEVLHQFIGHKNNVCSVNWSNLDSNLLGSASADGTVQVWNIETKEPISNMRGHDGRVFAVCWSLINSHLLVSGGEDQTVRLWNYSTQPFKTCTESQTKKPPPPELAISLNKKLEQQQQQQQQPNQESISPPSSASPTLQQQINSTSPSPSLSSTTNNTDEILPKKRPILLLNKDIVQKVDNSQYVIPLAKYCLSTDSIEKEKVDFDFGIGSNNSEQQNNKIEAIFSEKKLIIDKLIQKESLELLKIDDVENYISINCWNPSNLKQALYQVIKHGKLTGNIVSLSIQAGREIYESICYLYSQQLICVGDYHLAVSYLLMIGRVNDAIQVYRNSLLFQEAILLAKSRYPIDDPIINQLFIEWAKQTETAHPIHSIKCYLSTIQDKQLNSKNLLLKLLSLQTKQILKIQPDLEQLLNNSSNNNINKEE